MSSPINIPIQKIHNCSDTYLHGDEQCESASGPTALLCPYAVEDISIHISSHDGYQNLSNPDEIVITDTPITIDFDYPLNKTYSFEFTNDSFTRRQVIEYIVSTYKFIYEEEERTTATNVMTIAERLQRGGLINRNTTSGIYGIWGHDLSDLVIEKIIYYPQEQKIRMFIGS